MQAEIVHVLPPYLRQPRGFGTGGDCVEICVGVEFGVDQIEIHGGDTVCYDGGEWRMYESGAE